MPPKTKTLTESWSTILQKNAHTSIKDAGGVQQEHMLCMPVHLISDHVQCYKIAIT